MQEVEFYQGRPESVKQVVEDKIRNRMKDGWTLAHISHSNHAHSGEGWYSILAIYEKNEDLNYSAS